MRPILRRLRRKLGLFLKMAESPVRIARLRYTHDAVIDEILMRPEVSQNELARMFGFSVGWMSICINSDAFQNRLKERKAELTDPAIRATINERLDAVAKVALDKILDRLDNPAANIKNADLIQMAKLGVGDKNTRAVAAPTQNLDVVQLPAQAPTAEAWVANSSRALTPRPLPLAEEVDRG